MQNQFYQRFSQGQGNFDNADQGTWQMPAQQQQQGQEETYFTGNSTNYYTNQQAAGVSGSTIGSGHVAGGSTEEISPVFSTGIANYNKSIVGNNKGLQNTGVGNQSQYNISDSQSQQAGSHSQFTSNQGSMHDRYGGKIARGSQDDNETGYYGFPNESYMTNSGGNVLGMNSASSGNLDGGGNSVNIGGFGGNSINIGNSSANVGSSAVNVGNNSMNMGNSGNSMNIGNNTSAMAIGGGGMGMGNSGNFTMNMMGNYGSDNMMMGMANGNGGSNMGMNNGVNNIGMNSGVNSMGINSGVNSMGMNSGVNSMGMNTCANSMGMNSGVNSMGMDSSGKFGNAHLQNQLMAAAVGMGALATWHENYGNNLRFNNASGNFGNNKRERQGRGSGPSQFRSPDMLYNDGASSVVGAQRNTSGGHNLTITLSATNHNQWCFLRKKFNKRDNDLAEHLFDIHEKFCHHCRDRIEEKKYGKKKKYSEELKETVEPPVEKEIPDEELTEEELSMKKLMGFAGFRSTKGSRVKDNNYSTVSSLNSLGSSDAVDGTTTLTEAEKKMIALRGGFSVFTKSDILGTSYPGFGAPAVTFEPGEGRGGPGFSNEPLFNNKSISK